jgi:hypothetical protein
MLHKFQLSAYRAATLCGAEKYGAKKMMLKYRYKEILTGCLQ